MEICSNDEVEPATVFCEDCSESFCDECFSVIHKARSRRDHSHRPISGSGAGAGSAQAARRSAPIGQGGGGAAAALAAALASGHRGGRGRGAIAGRGSGRGRGRGGRGRGGASPARATLGSGARPRPAPAPSASGMDRASRPSAMVDAGGLLPVHSPAGDLRSSPALAPRRRVAAAPALSTDNGAVDDATGIEDAFKELESMDFGTDALDDAVDEESMFDNLELEAEQLVQRASTAATSMATAATRPRVSARSGTQAPVITGARAAPSHYGAIPAGGEGRTGGLPLTRASSAVVRPSVVASSSPSARRTAQSHYASMPSQQSPPVGAGVLAGRRPAAGTAGQRPSVADNGVANSANVKIRAMSVPAAPQFQLQLNSLVGRQAAGGGGPPSAAGRGAAGGKSAPPDPVERAPRPHRPPPAVAPVNNGHVATPAGGARGRSITSPGPGGGAAASGGALHLDLLSGVDLRQRVWYFGPLSSKDAFELMRPLATGSYLVRCSSRPGCFVVSWVKSPKNIIHTLCSVASGGTHWAMDGETKTYRSIDHCVQSHVKSFRLPLQGPFTQAQTLPSGEQVLICESCGKTYDNASNLAIHQARRHSEEDASGQLKVCPQCAEPLPLDVVYKHCEGCGLKLVPDSRASGLRSPGFVSPR